jgi:putative transposase
VQAIGTARRRHDFDVHAYVIMPEHVHLLVRPRREKADFASFLRDLKRPVSWKAKKYLEKADRRHWLDSLTFTHGSRSVFRFWQPGGGFDRNITEMTALWEVCQYIHGNPVRRGLVQEPLEWKWSSARFWAGCEDAILEMDPLP